MRRRKTVEVLAEEFDKTQLVEKELVDKISLWMLRIIIKLGGAREFLDSNNCFKGESIAYFLEVGKYVDMARDNFKRGEVLAILKRNHLKLEKKREVHKLKNFNKKYKTNLKTYDFESC